MSATQSRAVGSVLNLRFTRFGAGRARISRWIECAFCSLMTVEIEVHPICYWISPRASAHVFLYMLAYYLEWRMQQALAPMLIDED